VTSELSQPPIVAVFARAPVAGRVKTRLARAVGDDVALAVHRELLQHTLATVKAACGADAELWLDGSADATVDFGLPVRAQPPGDLGQRMLAVIESIVARHRAAIVVGSDCGVLDVSYVQAARSALQDADVVLGPVEDGGYILIGMRRAIPEVLLDMRWSTATVTRDTLRRAEAIGATVELLPALWDIDDAHDLLRWRALGAPQNSR
jgi:rSAM/selenodomain-associated transferase 1